MEKRLLCKLLKRKQPLPGSPAVVTRQGATGALDFCDHNPSAKASVNKAPCLGPICWVLCRLL